MPLLHSISLTHIVGETGDYHDMQSCKAVTVHTCTAWLGKSGVEECESLECGVVCPQDRQVLRLHANHEYQSGLHPLRAAAGPWAMEQHINVSLHDWLIMSGTPPSCKQITSSHAGEICWDAVSQSGTPILIPSLCSTLIVNLYPVCFGRLPCIGNAPKASYNLWGNTCSAIRNVSLGKNGQLGRLELISSQQQGSFSRSLVHMRGFRLHSCHWGDPKLGGESADIVYRKRIPGVQSFMRSTQCDTAQLSRYMSCASIQHVARGVSASQRAANISLSLQELPIMQN